MPFTKMWTQRFAPLCSSELCVHAGKVNEVRETLVMESWKNVLVVTGPCGSAKYTTLQLIGKECGFRVCPWIAPAEKAGEFFFQCVENAGSGELEADKEKESNNYPAGRLLVFKDFPFTLFEQNPQEFRKRLFSCLNSHSNHNHYNNYNNTSYNTRQRAKICFLGNEDEEYTFRKLFHLDGVSIREGAGAQFSLSGTYGQRSTSTTGSSCVLDDDVEINFLKFNPIATTLLQKGIKRVLG